MRLSVIIPNYNYGDYVGAAIESALSLDWPDVEVIVVDDGSTDHSRDVISTFGDRITAIFQPNATQRVACNVGYARATGDAIMFLDSDDLAHPNLAKEVAALWRPSLSKVQVQMMRIDADGQPLNSLFPRFKPMPTPAKIRHWAARTTAYPTPPGSGNVYARSFLDRLFPLNDSCGAASDSACIAAAPFLGEVETIAKPLVFYRVHGANDSALMNDPTRFAREIRRAASRAAFADKLMTHALASTGRSICDSLEVLQFRVASFKLVRALHPIESDSVMRIIFDSIRVPWAFEAATPYHRAVIAFWSIITMLSPRLIAQQLIFMRYC